MRLIKELWGQHTDMPSIAPMTAYWEKKEGEKVMKIVSKKMAVGALRVMLREIGVAEVEVLQYSLKSARAGGATALAAAGVSEGAIMAAGRWRSNTWKVYVRPTIEEARVVSEALMRRGNLGVEDPR
jgi:hypothetical protein